jgi:hypothetical protein
VFSTLWVLIRKQWSKVSLNISREGEELSKRGVKVRYLLARAVSNLACKSGHSLCFHLDGSWDSPDYAEKIQREKQHDG